MDRAVDDLGSALGRRGAASASPGAMGAGGSAPTPPTCPTRRLPRRAQVFAPGHRFRTLFVVRTGCFKVSAEFVDGTVQIFAFPMAGDVLGLDALHTGVHRSEAVALEDAVVFELSFAVYERWLQLSAQCQHRFAQTLSDQIVRDQELMLLRAAPAEQRLATFLLDLSGRYQQLGFSRSRFIVRMTRADMGRYLDLKLETASRCLSHFHRQGMIQVQGKSIALLDFQALWRLSGRPPQEPRHAPARILSNTGVLLCAPP